MKRLIEKIYFLLKPDSIGIKFRPKNRDFIHNNY